MTNETTSIIETEQAQNSLHTTLPEAEIPTAIHSNPMRQPVQAPASQLPMSKQAQRQQLQSKFVLVRCGAEVLASAPVNEECGPRYNGSFEVRLDSLNEVTAKTLSTFTGNGAVHFTPNNIDEHPSLKKIRKAEDGINLSALMTRAKRPANIDDASWQVLVEMWKDVSTVLYNHGLAPLHALINRALAEKGVGGPKISKKLSGGMNANAEDKHKIMCQVLDRLNELLTDNAMTK